MDLYIYIDESGVIPKPETIVGKNNCFIMSFVITTKPQVVEREFRHSLIKFIKNNPTYQVEFNNCREVKGSHILEKNKPSIYNSIIEKCKDFTEIGVIQLHNFYAKDKFRIVPARSFNYLIWKFLIRYYSKYGKVVNAPINHIRFVIDERNVSTHAEHDLAAYLELKNFELEKPFFNSVSVVYVDSSNEPIVQFADMIANTYFRWLRFGKSGSIPNSVKALNLVLVNQKVFEFPIINNVE